MCNIHINHKNTKPSTESIFSPLLYMLHFIVSIFCYVIYELVYVSIHLAAILLFCVFFYMAKQFLRKPYAKYERNGPSIFEGEEAGRIVDDEDDLFKVTLNSK